MATESDVENTLVGIISAALYPNGTGQPCAAGIDCKVFRGWPTVQNQELTKTQNYVNVSVSTRNGVERNTSCHPFVNFQTVTAPVHTLTATVSGTQITIGGTVAVPQNVIVLIGNDARFSYAVQSADSLGSVATGLATLIAASFSGTTSSGPVVTVNSDLPMKARIAASGTVIQELRRQEKSFQISIWAPPSDVVGTDADHWRSAVDRIVDTAIAQLVRIVLPDQTYAHIHYGHQNSLSKAQAQGLYRHDFFYWVDYATTLTSTAYEIGTVQVQLQGSTQDLPPPADALTLTNNY